MKTSRMLLFIVMQYVALTASAFDQDPAQPPVITNEPAVSATPVTNETVHQWYGEIETNSPVTLQTLDKEQRQFLYTATFCHPIANLDRVNHYDPQGLIGFCFGRSMTAYLIARRMGVHPDSLRELFIIGKLVADDGRVWRFHVTTLVRGDDQDWYAIDPIMGRPLAVKTWVARMRQGWDRQELAHLYIVPGSTVIPDLRVLPDINAETGVYIIETKFTAADKPGFTPRFELGKLVYEVTDAQSWAYFACVHEPLPSDRFHFLGIDVNHFHLEYNGYFVDLIRDLRFAPDSRFLPSPVLETLPQGGRDDEPTYIGGCPLGFQLELLLGKGY